MYIKYKSLLEDMRIIIIGAGPAGSHTAFHLAKKGHEVVVYERNKEIGPPVQCTGILSDYFSKLMEPSDQFVLNVVTRTRIHAPNGDYLETPIQKNYVVCRKKFDNYLAQQAQKAGAKYYMGHSFQGFEEDPLRVTVAHNGQKSIVEADALVGADGPLSPVAKAADLFADRQHIIGTQVEAKMANDNVVDFFPHIGCYGWIVPVTQQSVRIGVAAYSSPVKLFKKMAKEHVGEDYKDKTIENQSGVIPLFYPRIQANKGRVYLIGDAATFNKATSGGGINQALKLAGILAECIDTGRDYDRAWKSVLYRNLHMHLIVHKMMQQFSEEDWNRLIRVFSRPSLKKVLYQQSRDNIIPMLFRIAASNPALFTYGRYFPPDEIRNLLQL